MRFQRYAYLLITAMVGYGLCLLSLRYNKVSPDNDSIQMDKGRIDLSQTIRVYRSDNSVHHVFTPYSYGGSNRMPTNFTTDIPNEPWIISLNNGTLQIYCAEVE